MKKFHLSTLLLLQTPLLLDSSIKFANIHHSGTVNLSNLFSTPLIISVVIAGSFAYLLIWLLIENSLLLQLDTAKTGYSTHFLLTFLQKWLHNNKNTLSSEIVPWKCAPNTPTGKEDFSTDDTFSLLLVTSDKIFSSELAKSLSPNFQITHLDDPEDIISCSFYPQPDAIIIDEDINGVHGDELCSRFKAKKEVMNIPIVLLVRTDDGESYASHKKCGADLLEPCTTDIYKFKTDIHVLINSHRQLHQSIKMPFPNTVSITLQLPEPKQKGDDNRKFMELVNRKLQENLSKEGYRVEDMASDLGVSRSRLYKRVHAIMGKSPKDYMIDFKMEAAATLLVTTEASIGEIFTLVGYCDSKHFSKEFKKYYGMPPTEYRKLHSQKSTE